MSAASELTGTNPTPATPTPAPAPTPPATPPETPPATPPAPEHWTSTIEDDQVRDWAQNRGWQSPADALKAHRELESLRGVPADRLLKLPEPGDAEGMKSVYQRLGAPASPDGYELPAPAEGQVDLTPDMKTWAHELGLSQEQAKGLAERYGAKSEELAAAEAQARVERAAAEVGELKKAWGPRYQENILAGQHAARIAAEKLGMDASEFEARLSNLEEKSGESRLLLQLFALFGNGMSEFRAGRDDVTATTPFGMTPEAAREQIRQLESDTSFMDKALKAGTEERARRDRLYKIAYPG